MDLKKNSAICSFKESGGKDCLLRSSEAFHMAATLRDQCLLHGYLCPEHVPLVIRGVGLGKFTRRAVRIQLLRGGGGSCSSIFLNKKIIFNLWHANLSYQKDSLGLLVSPLSLFIVSLSPTHTKKQKPKKPQHFYRVDNATIARTHAHTKHLNVTTELCL